MGFTIPVGLMASTSLTPPAPFPMDVYVSIGASMEDFAFTGGYGAPLAVAIAKYRYNKTITVFEAAVANTDSAYQSANIASLIAPYTSMSNVVYGNGIGGNDDAGANQNWNEISTAAKNQQIANINAVWDYVESQGGKYIQTPLTFRNYIAVTPTGGNSLDPVPYPKINEIYGSYSKNQSWLNPIIQTRQPTYIRSDGIMIFSHYEESRSIYDWSQNTGDPVHNNGVGEMAFIAGAIEPVLQVSLGIPTTSPVQVDFTQPFVDPTINIDVVCALFNDNVAPNNPNINWVRSPSGNYGSTYPPSLYSGETMVNTDGTPATGVAVVFVGFNTSQFQTGAVPYGSDRTATLSNARLLSSGVAVVNNGGAVGAVIYGLQPNAKYSVQYANITTQDFTFGANTIPQNYTGVSGATVNCRADTRGRIFLKAKENSSGNTVGFYGIRVKSANSPAPSAPVASIVDDSTLIRWCDSSSILSFSIDPAVSESITRMKDIGFTANALTPFSSTQRALYKANVKGSKGVVRFDGTDDCFYNTSIVGAFANGDFTMTFCFKSNPAILTRQFLYCGRVSGNNRTWMVLDNRSGVNVVEVSSYEQSGGNPITSAYTPNSNTRVLTMVRAGGVLRWYLDNTVLTAHVATNVALSTEIFGAGTTAGANAFAGDLYESRLFTSAKTQAEVLAVHSELLTKWA